MSVFFISYSIFEPLSNILLKRMRPSIYIPIIVILWGTCTTLLGIVKNFSHLCAVRWFLGMTEAGLFPGVNYYLSCWYKRSEFGIRAAIFVSSPYLINLTSLRARSLLIQPQSIVLRSSYIRQFRRPPRRRNRQNERRWQPPRMGLDLCSYPLPSHVHPPLT